MSAGLVTLERARRGLTAMLPDTAYLDVSNDTRVWTSSTGSWSLAFSSRGGGHGDRLAVFAGTPGGWRAEVPLTVPGLDSLVAVMVAAGAIEPPRGEQSSRGDTLLANGIASLVEAGKLGGRWDR